MKKKPKDDDDKAVNIDDTQQHVSVTFSLKYLVDYLQEC